MGERRILGVDPGLAATGYGVVEGDRAHARALAWGAIRSTTRLPREQRLRRIYHALLELIDEHRPVEVSLEQQYVRDNVRSALSLGEARAAAMLAAAERDLPVREYAPTAVKQAVAGHGGAAKEQVQAMLALQLGMTEAPTPLDASDALAIALTCLADAGPEWTGGAR